MPTQDPDGQKINLIQKVQTNFKKNIAFIILLIFWAIIPWITVDVPIKVKVENQEKKNEIEKTAPLGVPAKFIINAAGKAISGKEVELDERGAFVNQIFAMILTLIGIAMSLTGLFAIGKKLLEDADLGDED